MAGPRPKPQASWGPADLDLPPRCSRGRECTPSALRRELLVLDTQVSAQMLQGDPVG